MTTTQHPTVAETEAREFAAQYPTANVLAGIAHAEAGRVAWDRLRDLFASSLAEALGTCVGFADCPCLRCRGQRTAAIYAANPGLAR